jgi:hypothetical protein
VAGARVLREVHDAGSPRPDVPGAIVLTGAVGTLIGAIVQGPTWGWGDARVIGLFAAAVGLAVTFGVRTVRHESPVVEPDLLRVRAFAAANGASVLFFVGFATMLLGSVLFLTEVRGDSVLRAGLEIAPGPATATLFAVPSGVLGQRIGPRPVGALGALLFAAGGIWWAAHAGASSHYASDYLPGMLIGGAGVGLVNPALASAATAQLPAARLATGSAILTMSRQLGSALGVALFVAVLGTPSPAELAGAFRDVWTLMYVSGLGAALAFLAVGPVRAGAPATVPAGARVEAAA